jgi:hypothetical protein
MTQPLTTPLSLRGGRMPGDPPSSPALRSGPELIIDMRVSGGEVELVLAPGMVVDANELSVRHSRLGISRDAGDNAPETLRVRLAGRLRYGRIDTRWLPPSQ